MTLAAERAALAQDAEMETEMELVRAKKENDADDNLNVGKSMRIRRRRRAWAAYRPQWQRFLTFGNDNKKNVYQKQYSHIYALRLLALRSRCWDSLSPLGGAQKTERIIDVKESVESAMVGTLVKEMACRPPLSETVADVPVLEPLRTYCQDDDDDADEEGTLLYLEDESGRLQLQLTRTATATPALYELVTGIVVGVVGTVDPQTGILHVTRLCYPAPASPPPPALAEEGPAWGGAQVVGNDTANTTLEEEAHVLLVSGLQCGSPDGSLSLSHEMLLDYLCGHCAQGEGAKVCRVVICGGAAFGPSTRDLDLYVSQVCAAGLFVDLLPEMSTCLWPQRPVHSCLMPQSSAFCFVASKETPLLRRGPNPYQASVGGRVFLGTDGQNLVDLAHYVAKKKEEEEEEEPESMDQDSVEKNDSDTKKEESTRAKLVPCSAVDLLEWTLTRYSHLCPTGPDSLPMVPNVGDEDPFVIDQQPHVYFAGGGSHFESRKLGENVRLVSVPSFATTQQAVLVNLQTLDCRVLQFSVQMEEEEEDMGKCETA